MEGVSAMLGAKMDRRGQKRAMRFAREVGQNQIQWRVADLKKAGLNPILAAGGGVSGGAGPNIGAPKASTPGSSWGQTAQGISKLRLEKQNLKKMGDQLEEQTALATAQANEAYARERKTRREMFKLDTDEDYMAASARQAWANAKRIGEETKILGSEVQGAKAVEELYRQYPQLRKWGTIIKDLTGSGSLPRR